METDQYIGVDLHKAFFQACAITPNGERLWEGRFPRTAEGIAAFVARCTPQSGGRGGSDDADVAFRRSDRGARRRRCASSTRARRSSRRAMRRRPIGSMRGGWPMRCGARASSAFTCRRRRFASCANCAGIG